MIETPDYADMMERMIRAYGRRVGGADPVDLSRMLQIRDAMDQAIVDAVRGQHEAGFSWREIGEALGTTRQSAQITYGRHGKGGRERLVPLTSDAARQLRALPDGYAFPGDDHGHLSPRWVGTLANRLLADDWTIHKLRHRAATAWWLTSGGDVLAVGELLGHADPKTTKVYVKIPSTRLRAILTEAAA